jgi:hypothetical protein
MKNSIPMVAGLIAITTSLVTGCSSTPNSSSSSSSQVPTSTTSSSAQTPTASSVQSAKTASSPATSLMAPSASANTSVAICQTQHLSLTQGRVGAAAGSTYVTYYLQNHGPSTCSMLGYPGFSLLFANGSVIQHPAARNGSPYRVLLLLPGHRAQFVVRTVDAAISGSGCSTGWKTAKVQVYPPNQTVPIRQPSSIAACDLSVGPVSAA